jgi:hypothetical protein
MGQSHRDDGYGLGAQIAAAIVCIPLIGFGAVMCWIALALFGVVPF